MKRTIFLIVGLIGIACYHFFWVAPAEKTYQEINSELSESYSIGVDGLLQRPDSALTALDQDSSLAEAERSNQQREILNKYGEDQHKLREAKNAADSSRKWYYGFLSVWSAVVLWILAAWVINRVRQYRIRSRAQRSFLNSDPEDIPFRESGSLRRGQRWHQWLNSWLREMPIHTRLLICAGLMLLLVLFGWVGWWPLATVFPLLAIILLLYATPDVAKRWFLYMIPIMYVVIWIATIIAYTGGAQ